MPSYLCGRYSGVRTCIDDTRQVHSGYQLIVQSQGNDLIPPRLNDRGKISRIRNFLVDSESHWLPIADREGAGMAGWQISFARVGEVQREQKIAGGG
jgi:hypothetical protein